MTNDQFTNKPSRLQPVLLGGLVLGLGSVIPGVSYGNLCCYGWAIAGGALAANLLIKRSPIFPITSGEGASTGALSGVVGSLINLVIGVPLSLLQWNSLMSQVEGRVETTSDPASREAVKQAVSIMQNHPALIALGIWLIFTIVAIIAAAVGGMIGVAFFEKRKGQHYPPPQGPPSSDYEQDYGQGPPHSAPY